MMEFVRAATSMQIEVDWNAIVNQLIDGLLVALVIAIILLIGHLIGILAKRATVFALRRTVDPALSKTDLGQNIAKSGVDIS